jgi:hypothetical protein
MTAWCCSRESLPIWPLVRESPSSQLTPNSPLSRPHLIGLLAGEIEYRKVGKHRRRSAADELSALTQEMDLT